MFYLPQLRPCRLATTENISNLATGAPSLVDGQTPLVGDRIFVPLQTVGVEIGIYVVRVVGAGVNGTWIRSDDLPYGAINVIYPGSSIYISEGTANGQTKFTVTNSGVITIGTTSLTLVQEALLVRTDATSTEIKASGAFSAAIQWSTALNVRDFKEVSVWFIPTDLGTNTRVDFYVKWSDDGTTIVVGDDDGLQQTDFLISNGTDGSFKVKNYNPYLTTASGELVVNSAKMMTFPKKGGVFYFGVKGTAADGAFSLRAQRLN